VLVAFQGAVLSVQKKRKKEKERNACKHESVLGYLLPSGQIRNPGIKSRISILNHNSQNSLKFNSLDEKSRFKHANFCARRCLWDQKPRSFDSERVAMLCNFSELVARELEASAVLQWKQTVSRTLKRAMDCYHQAYLFVDVSVEGWQVMHANQAFCDRTGGRPGECSLDPACTSMCERGSLKP
jgi:hypothetical protein